MDVDTFPRGNSKSTPDLHQFEAFDLMDVDTLHNMLPDTQNSICSTLWELYGLVWCPYRLHEDSIPPSKGLDWG